MRLKLVLFLLFVSTGVSAASAASIMGTVKYKGDIPHFRPISMSADPVCASEHAGTKVFPQTLVLGPGQTMADVFVRILNGLPKQTYKTPSTPVIISQRGCQYHPHVVGVMVGQPVKFLNPDGTLHNVHGLPKKNPKFNLAMPKFIKTVTHVFHKPEFMFPIRCNVHPWMNAWIAVMSNPYFDTTKKNGRYKITGLPPGTYEIQAWHERLGTKTADVTLKKGQTAVVNFTFVH